MRIVFSKAAKKNVSLTILIFLIIFIILNIFGYIIDCKYISVFTAVNEIDKYEVRSRLLQEAMDNVGSCNPKDAAEVWSSGLKKRSAAIQYSVMSKRLKESYAKQLEECAPNWVTGVSSPWVESFKIVKTIEISKNKYIFEILFSTATSSGPAGEYKAILDVSLEDGFWRIVSINADKQLYPYTRFNP